MCTYNFRIYERLGCKFKSVKFAQGKQNRKFLVVFDDRVDTWEINSLGMVSPRERGMRVMFGLVQSALL